MVRRFSGRNVIVTGASRGIGAAIAERFAAEGAAVAITARTLDHHTGLAGSLSDTAERCARFGATVVTVVADLADSDDRARILPEAEAALGGPIDILVNNAAATIRRPAAEMALRHRRVVFEVTSTRRSTWLKPSSRRCAGAARDGSSTCPPAVPNSSAARRSPTPPSGPPREPTEHPRPRSTVTPTCWASSSTAAGSG